MLNIFLLQPWRRGPAWGGGDGGGGGGPGGDDGTGATDADNLGGLSGAAEDAASISAVSGGPSGDDGTGIDLGTDDGPSGVAEVDTSDGGFLGVSDGGSGYVDVDSADATSSADVGDADFGMGSIDGVSDVGVSDIGSGGGFLGVSDGGSGYVDPGVSDTGSNGYDVGPSGYVSVDAMADVNTSVAEPDYGMGSVDGVPDVGVSDVGVVSTETIGNNTGLSGEEFDDIGLVNTTGSGGVSANVPDLGFDFGMGSGTGINVGVGTSAGEEDVDPSGYNIGPSGYISVDAIADTGIDPETNYGDANPNSPNAYFDAFGNAYNTQIEAEVADNVAAGYNDVPDMGGNTFEEYEAEYGTSPDFTNSGDFDPDEYLGGPGDGEGDNGAATTPADTVPDFAKVEYNFNTSLEASPYGGMWSNITSTIPKYEFDAYEDADGLLRFSENDEPVPEEILKYMPYAKKTLIVEEEETEEETEE